MEEAKNKQAVVQAYFHGLEKGNYQDIISLFSPEAIVHSPLYGQVEAVVFYKQLFSDTQNSKIILANIFINAGNPNVAAAHFIYEWTMRDGMLVEFECVDIFHFAPHSDKILFLTIIYDTYRVRNEFLRIHNNVNY